MAIPGEWTVTNSRVVDDTPKEPKIEAVASGVRKRGITKDETEEEECMELIYPSTTPEDSPEVEVRAEYEYQIR